MARPVGLEHAAQPGNVPLYQVHSIPRQRLTPYGIDHLLSADRPPRLKRQHRQDHPLLERPKIYKVPPRQTRSGPSTPIRSAGAPGSFMSPPPLRSGTPDKLNSEAASSETSFSPRSPASSAARTAAGAAAPPATMSSMSVEAEGCETPLPYEMLSALFGQQPGRIGTCRWVLGADACRVCGSARSAKNNMAAKAACPVLPHQVRSMGWHAIYLAYGAYRQHVDAEQHRARVDHPNRRSCHYLCRRSVIRCAITRPSPNS